ncbi:MAG: TonB-dependent receptor, partial [Candidatus Kapabacteria bacterium]|nr:TonB-dependent receptor [Candidatus Kapabacteria bacterium]
NTRMRIITTIIFSVILMFAFSIEADAQRSGSKISAGGIVKGQVVESHTGKPLGYTNVILYDSETSAQVTGAIADRNGNFKIEKIPAGNYYLIAKFIGYKKKKINKINISKTYKIADLKKVRMNEDDMKTATVEVEAERQIVEFKMDKKIVNVSQDISSAGNSAVDALENVPTVNVDIEGNVTLRGNSNFKVFVDGRPSILSGTDALEQIPASAIDNIELITNPSAKYDPDNMSGIINIITKKDFDAGFSGNVNLSGSTNGSYNAGVLLNYTAPKFQLSGGIDYGMRDRTGEGDILKKFYLQDSLGNDYTNIRESDVNGDNTSDRFSAKLGGLYKFTDKSSLSMTGNIGSRNHNHDHSSTTAFTQTPGDSISFFTDENTSDYNRFYYGVNLDYMLAFEDPGHELTAAAYFSDRTSESEGMLGSMLTDENWVNLYEDPDFRTNSKDDENGKRLRLKLDYTYPINETDVLEAGAQSRVKKDVEDNIMNMWDPESDMWVKSDRYSNSMDYLENIHSIYASYSAAISEFKYKVGLRGEYTLREISFGTGDPFTLDRFDLFPTAHASLDLGKDYQAIGSFSRRIHRPHGRSLDPTPMFINSTTIRMGNPELEPEFINSYELGVQKYFGKSFLSLESYYRVTNNKISRITEVVDEVSYLTSANLDKDYTFGVELSANYQTAKWLILNGSANYYNYRISGELNDETVDNSSNAWTTRLNVTAMLSSNLRLQLNGMYRAPSVTAQGERAKMYMAGAAVRYDMMDRKLSFTLKVRDLFGTMKREYLTYTPDYFSSVKFQPQTQVITLSVSYKFNNFKQDKNRNGMDEEDFEMF